MMQCAIFRGQNTIELLLQISCSFRGSSRICTKRCFYKFPTYQPYIAHVFLLAISRKCRHTVRQQYPFYRLLAMESQRNNRQTVHYYPAENNTALGIIKIGLLQAEFCYLTKFVRCQQEHTCIQESNENSLCPEHR